MKLKHRLWRVKHKLSDHDKFAFFFAQLGKLRGRLRNKLNVNRISFHGETDLAPVTVPVD